MIWTRLVTLKLERSKYILEYISEVKLSGLAHVEESGNVMVMVPWSRGVAGLREGLLAIRAVRGSQRVERDNKCKLEKKIIIIE